MADELTPEDDGTRVTQLTPAQRVLLDEIRQVDAMEPTRQVMGERGVAQPIGSPESYGLNRLAGADEIAEELRRYLVGDNTMTMDELVHYLQSTQAGGAMDGLSGQRIYDIARSAQTHAKLADAYEHEGRRTNAHQQNLAATGNTEMFMADIMSGLIRHGGDFAANVTPESVMNRLTELPNLPWRNPNNSEPQR